ncbi:2-keto-4-pentenoate hydratase [Embleya sp. NPDC008237]|uniref:2-keto-4-pentenoate hydratase n=1 Tax=Embleya sp. NPDC008237 TaxID=3363978 RepID=UPI0036F143F1
MTCTSSHGEDAVRAAAERLLAAAETGRPCAPVRDLIGPDDLAAAYAVQRRVVDDRPARGARVVGRRIGLTSAAVQQQLGVDQPDFGVLFDDMGYAVGDVVPYRAVLQPRVEAEIAFVLGADLADGPLDRAHVHDAIDHAVAALEICGSRMADWDIRFADVVSTGTGTACLGDPVEAVAWPARQARDLGDPLRAGQLVLSGALGPMRPVVPGDTVRADITGPGTVAIDFGSDEEGS